MELSKPTTKDEIGLLVEESFRASGSEQGDEDPYVHFGYLGKPDLNASKTHYLAALNETEEVRLNSYYKAHKNDKNISCEMDAISVLFPKKLIELSDGQYKKLRTRTDPVYDSF